MRTADDARASDETRARSERIGGCENAASCSRISPGVGQRQHPQTEFTKDSQKVGIIPDWFGAFHG